MGRPGQPGLGRTAGGSATAGRGATAHNTTGSPGSPPPRDRVALLPLRLATTGELLDGAVALLRRCARTILPLAVAAAIAEQVTLRALGRPDTSARGPFVFFWQLVTEHWGLLAFGFATESFIIAILATVAARALVPALTGTDRKVRGPLRLGATVLVALPVAIVTGFGYFFGFLPGVFAYFLCGLMAPALIIDQVGPLRAIRRGSWLLWRSPRAGGVRLLGYLAWLLIRWALGFGGLVGLGYVAGSLTLEWVIYGDFAIWVIANSVAYAMLACLDATLEIDARIKVEGLDIAIARCRARNAPVGPIMAVTR
jgi:hypothetical protein